MSKKVAEQHELLSVAVQMAKNISNIDSLQRGGKPSDHWGRVLLDELGRLTEENEALREALRLKEVECEALAHDKSVLLSFVKRVSELDIEEWNHEIACDAVDLIEDIEGADNENQQAD